MVKGIVFPKFHVQNTIGCAVSNFHINILLHGWLILISILAESVSRGALVRNVAAGQLVLYWCLCFLYVRQWG